MALSRARRRLRARRAAGARRTGLDCARLGRELRVDRHRCRPLPVRSCGDELCVARNVPRMAVDGAAARLVAEDGEPGRVVTGAGRFRAAARHELELLGVCLRIGLPAGGRLSS
jgi:hypothetical protein